MTGGPVAPIRYCHPVDERTISRKLPARNGSAVMVVATLSYNASTPTNGRLEQLMELLLRLVGVLAVAMLVFASLHFFVASLEVPKLHRGSASESARFLDESVASPKREIASLRVTIRHDPEAASSSEEWMTAPISNEETPEILEFRRVMGCLGSVSRSARSKRSGGLTHIAKTCNAATTRPADPRPGPPPHTGRIPRIDVLVVPRPEMGLPSILIPSAR